MNQNAVFLLCALSFQFGCGSDENQLNPYTTNEIQGGNIVEVMARSQFTPTGLTVMASNKLIIKQVGGRWTGGQSFIENGQLKPLYCGAAGCNGVDDKFGSPKPGLDSSRYMCGFTPRFAPGASLPAGRVLDGNGMIENINLMLTATGEVAAPGAANTYSVIIPAGNTGQCCTPNRKMIRNFVFGIASDYTLNDCALGNLSALIMKIVPEGQDIADVPPILVGNAYESRPLTATTSGKIYLGFNDLAWGHFDNSGSISVQIDVHKM